MAERQLGVVAVTEGVDSPKGVRIYRAADAVDPVEVGFHASNDFRAQPEALDAAIALGRAGGAVNKLLARQSPDEGGFSVMYVWFKPHFPLFRHRHDVDCMYVVVSGSARMGNQTLGPGDCFYVAAGAPYGYTAGDDGVEVIEIRHDADSFAFVLAPNSPQQIEHASETARTEAEGWAALEEGPLFRAAADVADRR
jgi:mannose-6-phosphate isomerase-like protein (cupin superfamily)